MTQARKKITASEFGIKIAKVMLRLKSSHCYFILQQAFGGEYLTWEEAEEIMKGIMRLPQTDRKVRKG
jgi:hypothetical protein